MFTKAVPKALEALLVDPDKPLLVDPPKAAQMMAVSKRKLWAMTFEDEMRLPHVRCGRLVRYHVADLLAWIEKHKQGGAQ